MEVRSDDARIYRVDADAFRRQFQRRAARQLIDSGFADAVCQYARERPQARHAGYIYDVAFALDDGGQCQLCELKDRTDVDVHHQVVVGQCRVFDRSAGDDSGGIDENVDSSEVFQYAANEIGGVLLAGQVGRCTS